MTTTAPTAFPPQVSAALERIRAECLREEWVPADELPDQAATYRYVTDSVYLPGADWKPGAGEFEDYGDASAHAYLVVLVYELVTAQRLARPGDPDAGVLRRSVAVDVDRRMLARTGGRYCPRTADLHRLAGTVLAAACLDCEIHGA